MTLSYIHSGDTSSEQPVQAPNFRVRCCLAMPKRPWMQIQRSSFVHMCAIKAYCQLYCCALGAANNTWVQGIISLAENWNCLNFLKEMCWHWAQKNQKIQIILLQIQKVKWWWNWNDTTTFTYCHRSCCPWRLAVRSHITLTQGEDLEKCNKIEHDSWVDWTLHARSAYAATAELGQSWHWNQKTS